MPTLFCFGLGYSAAQFLAAYGDRYEKIVATVRSPAKAASTPLRTSAPLEMPVFDGAASDEIVAALDEADALLTCVPPTQSGDPVLEHFAGVIARAARLERIVYLSTVGVYGDHGGAWVDESTEPRPVSSRSGARLAAERAWQSVARRGDKSIAILRLAGIYGPGRSALVNLRRGRAERIVKPGQVFNRIHVADLAQAIAAALARGVGIFNVADDEPAPPQDVLVFAANLLQCDVPREIPFAEAQARMTPMALSFYGENKRVRNAKLKAELGVALRYPTYREGLRALLEAEDCNAGAS